MLRCFVNANQDDWDEYLPQVVYAYNTTEHAATETTPFLALRGVELRRIWELNFSSKPKSFTTYVSKLQEKQKEVNEFLAKKKYPSKIRSTNTHENNGSLRHFLLLYLLNI
jgi:hypothetical protein